MSRTSEGFNRGRTFGRPRGMGCEDLESKACLGSLLRFSAELPRSSLSCLPRVFNQCEGTLMSTRMCQAMMQ